MPTSERGGAPARASIGILSGTTAAGKTAFALELCARRPEIEIVNADSLLVYRGFDLGTAKPTAGERARVPHHLIDICDPTESFTAGDFVRATEAALADIAARGRRALVVGGTGFYLKALLFGLWEGPPADPAIRARLGAEPPEALWRRLAARDPASAARIGARDTYRLVRALEIVELTGQSPSELERARPRTPDPRFALWFVDRADAELERRIEARAQAMLTAGWIEETRDLQSRWPGARSLEAVGYAQIVRHLAGEAPAGRKQRPGEAGLLDEIRLATRQLVKKQRTFYGGIAERAGGRRFTLDAELESLRQAVAELYS